MYNWERGFLDLLGLDIAEEANGNVITSICILCNCNVRKRIKINSWVLEENQCFYV